MKSSPVLQNVFGTIGTILWSAQIVPQIIKNYKSKTTYGLSSHLFIIWTTSAFFLGVYNILQNINVALIVQPQSFGLLGGFCWVQCLYYADGPEPDPEEEDYYDDPKRRRRKPLSFRNAALVFAAFIVLAVAFECGFVYVLRAAAKHPTDGSAPHLNQAGVQFFGITSAILISLGLMPQYFEIYRLRRVVGVSYLFMAIDTLGGVFSLLSLAFKEKWDVTAGINYALVILLDCLVLLLAAILNPLANRRAARAKARAEESKNPPAAEQKSSPTFYHPGNNTDTTPCNSSAPLDGEPAVENPEVGKNIPSEHQTSSNENVSVNHVLEHNQSGIMEDHNPHGV